MPSIFGQAEGEDERQEMDRAPVKAKGPRAFQILGNFELVLMCYSA